MTLDNQSAQQLAALARRLEPSLQTVRRCLHQHPELSGEEYETTLMLAEFLRDLGCEVNLANDQRGLWVDIGAATDRPRLAVRADIDALPIRTDLHTSYASRREGVMHACGHDAHAAIAVGVVTILLELAQEASSISARVLFQPEEETSRGGRHMIASGALDGIASAIALHVDPTLSVGTVGIRDGIFTAGCDTFTVEITGRGGHGARPNLTSDTIGAAAQWVTDVYRRIPRVTDARDAVVVNVGSLHSGSAANVVPSSAKLSGTLRTLTPSSCDLAKSQLATISAAVGSIHGCQVDLQFGQHTPPLKNDTAITGLLHQAGVDLLGSSSIVNLPQPSMGAEDFSFIANEVPAAMFRLGIAGPAVGGEPLHTSKFDIDEAALSTGASILALSVLRWNLLHQANLT